MKNTRFLSALLLLTFLSCKTGQSVTATESNPLHNIELNGKVYSAVFQQRAAEYRALCQQAFNIATWQLDLALQQPHAKPTAIVSDIDETFLDNSPYAVQMAKIGKSYEESTWAEWTAKGIAEPLAGSEAFFKYAASRGVEIFYITNRNAKDKAGTVANLKKYGFPFADEAHVIVRETVSSKEARRQKVAETHEIVMLLGDNLSDFSAAFDKKTEAQRLQGVTDNASLFGKKFIVLPNTGYGDWESAIFDYDYKRTTKQKDSIYLSKVKGF